MDKFKKFLKNKKQTKIGAFVIVFMFIAIFAGSILASQTDNMRGFGWGANTDGGLGWLSFNNCIDDQGNCSGVSYGVNIDSNTNLLNGYAWTPNFGWLKFGDLDLSDAPTGNGTFFNNAKFELIGSQYVLTGWARFCGVFISGCSGPIIPNTDYKRGGWDGWVSLRGTTSGGLQYGVVFSGDPVTGGSFSSYAWGGGNDTYGGANTTGVGWIDFSPLGIPVVFDPINEPTLVLNATSPVPLNNPVTLTWTGIQINQSIPCSATGGAPNDNWATPSRPFSPSTFTTFNISVPNTYTYTLTCTGINNNQVSSSKNVTVGVGINFYPDSFSVLEGDQATLHWLADPSDQILTNCVASSNPQTNTWDGGVNGYNPPSIESQLVDVPVSPTTYNLSCNDAGGNLINAEPISITWSVPPPPPPPPPPGENNTPPNYEEN